MNDFASEFFIPEFVEAATVGRSVIDVIFDNSEAITDHYGTSVKHYQPVITLKSADVERLQIKENTLIRIRSKSYLVTELIDEGFGFHKAHLEKE